MGYYVLRVLISPRSSKRARADLQVRRRTTGRTGTAGPAPRSDRARRRGVELVGVRAGRTRRPNSNRAGGSAPATAPNRAVRVGIGRGPPHDPKPPLRGELLTARLTGRALLLTSPPPPLGKVTPRIYSLAPLQKDS